MNSEVVEMSIQQNEEEDQADDESSFEGSNQEQKPKKGKKIRLNSQRRKRRQKSIQLEDDKEDPNVPGYANNFFDLDKSEYEKFSPAKPTAALDQSAMVDKTYDVLNLADSNKSNKSEFRLPFYEKVFRVDSQKTKVDRFLDYWWKMQKNVDSKVCVSTSQPELTNRDIILVKQNVFIRKTWEVENAGKDTWPYETAIMCETPHVYFLLPTINTIYVDPGEKVQITIVFKVMKKNIDSVSENKENKILEFKFSLFTPKDGRFGEPLRVYCIHDEQKFNDEWAELTPTGKRDELAPKIDRKRIWVE
jgi:hypothetical protein